MNKYAKNTSNYRDDNKLRKAIKQHGKLNFRYDIIQYVFDDVTRKRILYIRDLHVALYNTKKNYTLLNTQHNFYNNRTVVKKLISNL